MRAAKRLITLASARLAEKRCGISTGCLGRTVEHLLQELERNPAVRPLCESRHLIVNFGLDGAVWIDFSAPERPKARLVFDATNAEGEWSSRIKGGVFGYLSCLTAASVLTLVSARDESQSLIQPPSSGDSRRCETCLSRDTALRCRARATLILARDFPPTGWRQ